MQLLSDKSVTNLFLIKNKKRMPYGYTEQQILVKLNSYEDFRRFFIALSISKLVQGLIASTLMERWHHRLLQLMRLLSIDSSIHLKNTLWQRSFSKAMD